MPRIEKNPANEPTKFYSLFVPQIDWFQDLMEKRAMESSLSDYLIDLAIKDLRARKLLSKEELAQYLAYAKQKPDIRKTRFAEKKRHSTFSLYLPKKSGQEWIRGKLDSQFIKENCGVKSRSLYIWDLFVRDNTGKLTKSAQREWAEEMAKATRNRNKAVAA